MGVQFLQTGKKKELRRGNIGYRSGDSSGSSGSRSCRCFLEREMATDMVRLKADRTHPGVNVVPHPSGHDAGRIHPGPDT